MEEENIGESDLQLLLPLKAGQIIGVLGETRVLCRSLARQNSLKVIGLSSENDFPPNVLSVRIKTQDQRLPFPDESLHHLFVPKLQSCHQAWLPDEFHRVLIPGGWLFVGVGNTQSLKTFFRKQADKDQAKYSLSQCRDLFSQNGMKIKGLYGVRDSLSEMQYLVPLEIPQAVDFFFNQIFVSHTLPAVLVRRLAGVLVKTGFGQLLFPDFGIVAQRQITGENNAL